MLARWRLKRLFVFTLNGPYYSFMKKSFILDAQGQEGPDEL